ncbi:MAG: heme biosynthesis HemY N-terminal domain-containing protein, partial [Pseudomonadota bacterium]
MIIRALWLLVKLTIIVLIVVWFSDHPGIISIVWLDHQIDAPVGLVVFLFIGLLVLLFGGYRLYRWVAQGSDRFRRWRAVRSEQRTRQQMIKTLVVLASEEGDEALKLSKKTTK